MIQNPAIPFKYCYLLTKYRIGSGNNHNVEAITNISCQYRRELAFLSFVHLKGLVLLHCKHKRKVQKKTRRDLQKKIRNQLLLPFGADYAMDKSELKVIGIANLNAIILLLIQAMFEYSLSQSFENYLYVNILHEWPNPEMIRIISVSYRQHGIKIMKSNRNDNYNYIYPQCGDYQKFCISRLYLLLSKLISFYFIDLNRFYDKNMIRLWKNNLPWPIEGNNVLSKYQHEKCIRTIKILFPNVVPLYNKLCKYIDTHLALQHFATDRDMAMIFDQIGNYPYVGYIMRLFEICLTHLKEVRSNCPKNVKIHKHDQFHFLTLHHYFGFYDEMRRVNARIRWRIETNNPRYYYWERGRSNPDTIDYDLIDEIQCSKKTCRSKLWPKWKNIISIKWCHFCHLNNVVLKRCKGCRKVFYCGVTCQKKDWNLKNHKLFCVIN